MGFVYILHFDGAKVWHFFETCKYFVLKIRKDVHFFSSGHWGIEKSV